MRQQNINSSVMNTIYKKYIQIIAAAILSFTLVSCEKEIDVDLRSVEPRLVIEGKVMLDSLAKVKITKTKDFGEDNNYPPVEGAIVRISSDAGEDEELFLDNSGWYVATGLRGVVGTTYNLSVTYDEIEYTASSFLPPMVPIDSVTMFSFPVLDYEIPRIHFKDPVGKTNEYYRQKLYINSKYTKIAWEAMETDQSDGIKMVSLLIPSEKELVDEEIKKGDTILVELQSIDKGAFTFFDTLGNIDDALVNPTSNIKGGALGYFSAYSFDRKEIIADWKD